MLLTFVNLQLDFKVGWKKLKEVFGMAGVVKRADVKEDKDGKSRGMGTVTFDQPLEAVQAICILKKTYFFQKKTFLDVSFLDSALSYV